MEVLLTFIYKSVGNKYWLCNEDAMDVLWVSVEGLDIVGMFYNLRTWRNAVSYINSDYISRLADDNFNIGRHYTDYKSKFFIGDVIPVDGVWACTLKSRNLPIYYVLIDSKRRKCVAYYTGRSTWGDEKLLSKVLLLYRELLSSGN